MADVKLSYEELNTQCNRLNVLADDVTTKSGEVKAVVEGFGDMWEGVVRDQFEQDYQLLSKNINETVDIMIKVTTEITNYISSMQEVENAYGKEHVN